MGARDVDREGKDELGVGADSIILRYSDQKVVIRKSQKM